MLTPIADRQRRPRRWAYLAAPNGPRRRGIQQKPHGADSPRTGVADFVDHRSWVRAPSPAQYPETGRSSPSPRRSDSQGDRPVRALSLRRSLGALAGLRDSSNPRRCTPTDGPAHRRSLRRASTRVGRPLKLADAAHPPVGPQLHCAAHRCGSGTGVGRHAGGDRADLRLGARSRTSTNAGPWTRIRASSEGGMELACCPPLFPWWPLT